MIKKISELQKTAALERFAASLSRIWEHATQNDYACAMISASRGRYTKLENLKRTYDLSRRLKEEGYSFISTRGAYIEGFDTPQAKEVEEDSFFVIGNTKDFEQFKDDMVNLGQEFNQDSVAIINPEHNATIVGTQDFDEDGNPVSPGYGNEWDIGTFHPTQIGQFYSKWKNKKFEFRSHSSVDTLKGKSLAIMQHAWKQRKIKNV